MSVEAASRSCPAGSLSLCSSSSEVLFRELESRQAALRHFIQYLSESGEQKLLLQLLGSVRQPLAPVSPARSL